LKKIFYNDGRGGKGNTWLELASKTNDFWSKMRGDQRREGGGEVYLVGFLGGGVEKWERNKIGEAWALMKRRYATLRRGPPWLQSVGTELWGKKKKVWGPTGHNKK